MVHPEQRRSLRRLFEASDASVDDVLRALAVGRRRRLLRILGDERRTLTAVARALVAAQGEPTSADPVRFQQLYLELYHTDVPTLATVGLVVYDESTGELDLTDVGRGVVALVADVP